MASADKETREKRTTVRFTKSEYGALSAYAERESRYLTDAVRVLAMAELRRREGRRGDIDSLAQSLLRDESIDVVALVARLFGERPEMAGDVAEALQAERRDVAQ